MRRMSIARTPTLVAVVVVIAAVTTLPRFIRRVLLRRRIRAQREVLSKLASHAARARALGQAYEERATKPQCDLTTISERLRKLRSIQQRALLALAEARSRIDRDLLLLLQSTRPSIYDAAAPVLAPAAEHRQSTPSAAETRACLELAAEAQLAHRMLDERAVDEAARRGPLPRDEMLRDESAILDEMLRGGADRGGMPAVSQPAPLQHALRLMRATEEDLSFQAELLATQLQLAKATGYSRANFAYGSTPLRSWLLLFEQLRPCLAPRAAFGQHVRYAVLGSSLGSLCVFGACVYGWQTRGIELLPLLVEHATRIVHEARVTGVSFECADLLCCDFRELDIVMLASQCWDAALVGAVRAKLLAELAEGSLVVDYTDGLGRRDGASDEAQGSSTSQQPGRRVFHLELTVEAPVSWDGSHSFYVWRVL